MSDNYSDLDEMINDVTPSKLMFERHQANLEATIPTIDIVDKGENRQFSPEYS